MKERTLEDVIQEAARKNRDLIPTLGQGAVHRTGQPFCMTCHKEIDCCEIVNVNSKGCEIRAICDHGTGVDKEDFYKVTWQVPVAASAVDILEDENVGWAIRRAMADGLFFSQAHQFDFSSKR